MAKEEQPMRPVGSWSMVKLPVMKIGPILDV